MEAILIYAYLGLYPVYFFVRASALYRDTELRFRNQKTHLQYVKEAGEIAFNYQTLIWFYFLNAVA